MWVRRVGRGEIGVIPRKQLFQLFLQLGCLFLANLILASILFSFFWNLLVWQIAFSLPAFCMTLVIPGAAGDSPELCIFALVFVENCFKWAQLLVENTRPQPGEPKCQLVMVRVSAAFSRTALTVTPKKLGWLHQGWRRRQWPKRRAHAGSKIFPS